MAAVREAAGDTDRPDRIEPVSILDAPPLERPHGLPDPCALERDRRHDLDDRLNEVVASAFFAQQALGLTWPDGVVTPVELPVGNVMDERRQLDHVEPRPLGHGDLPGQAPDTVDVVPVMARGLLGEPGPDAGGDTRHQVVGVRLHPMVRSDGSVGIRACRQPSPP